MTRLTLVGRLERRLQTADGQSEVHVLSFGSRADDAAYLADPQRVGHRALLGAVDPSQWVLEVTDV